VIASQPTQGIDPHLGQSIPCCFFNFSKFSWRSARFSFERAIFSGWWYNTTGSPSQPGINNNPEYMVQSFHWLEEVRKGGECYVWEYDRFRDVPTRYRF